MADSQNIGQQLAELSDDDAIAILEGRLPSEDSEAVGLAAEAVRKGLLAEPDENVASSLTKAKAPEAGGPTATGQPWMKMAAAFALGVLLSTVSVVPLRVSEAPSGLGSATANVVFLDNLRSSGPQSLTTVSAGEPGAYVSLIAYPDFTDASTLTVSLERSSSAATQPVDANASGWLSIYSAAISAGTRDSVVINVPSELLSEGTYRLLISSERGPAGSVRFRVAPLAENIR